ncbi:DNA-binding protein [Halorubellus sp. JP-L1]|uniref:helix-turn-helix domain-containing protein n=1 Tax=Halorubellus sp. JP-L1 TaxID=2715753 RepID=UPI00140A4B82|nr:helix-turn-helix domain-containing protein [Halorubellus sp. JP-L1]NHN42691.1 DNA-binding protein [Halorubellus sp. JP-L1]
MGTIVDATMPADQFALADTFAQLPDVECETVQLVANDDDSVAPFVWLSASDMDDVHEALEADSSTRDVERLLEKEDRSLYHVTWQARIRIVVYLLGVEDGTLLDARGENGRWELRILFPSHDSVSATYDICQQHGVDLTIHRVKGVVESIDRTGKELTDKQYEALAAGIESDYYHVPRGRSLEELANELDISHQALSERLRRGHRTLIQQTLK